MNNDQFYSWLQHPEPPTLVMGVLNVTPDSFSDGGRFNSPPQALQRGLEMAQAGADLIDIGGESTRPGSDPVPAAAELDRILPVISALRDRTATLLSVDTYKSPVAREALAAGVGMINDISGLTFDSRMAPLARDSGVPVVIMHIKGKPKDMQVNPHYDDLLGEILEYFRERVAYALQAGLKRDRIILDPGIGFGKRYQDNYELIQKLGLIADLGYPVLVGPSRKAFIGQTLNLPPEERLEGTAAAVTASILSGANIVRVHDVTAMKRVATIADRIRSAA